MAIASRIKSSLRNLKSGLQFTGWLQYILNAVLVGVWGSIAAVGWWIGVAPALLFWAPLVVAGVLLLILLVDLCTLKFGIRPPEPLPRRQDEVGVFDLMRHRRSCRSFQTRDLTESDRAELLECVAAESRADGLIGDRPIRFEYIAAPLTVWPVVGAHEFLVAIAPREYDRRAVIDVGRSLQKVVIQATRMGLATCWIGPGADHKSIVRRLGERFDPEQDHIICVCAIGYASWFMPFVLRLARVVQHRRLPLSSLFFADPTFERPLDPEAEPFRQFGRCYEACQWSPSSFNGQPTRCAAVTEDEGGAPVLQRFDFCASTTSRFYAPVALGIWCANWEMGCEELGLPGRFRVLSPEERLVDGAPELPRYDVSWLPDPAE